MTSQALGIMDVFEEIERLARVFKWTISFTSRIYEDYFTRRHFFKKPPISINDGIDQRVIRRPPPGIQLPIVNLQKNTVPFPLPDTEDNWETTPSDSPPSNPIPTELPRRVTHQPKNCGFCRRGGNTKRTYESHNLRDKYGKITCRRLREHKCPTCNQFGHTRSYCRAFEAGDPRLYGYWVFPTVPVPCIITTYIYTYINFN